MAEPVRDARWRDEGQLNSTQTNAKELTTADVATNREMATGSPRQDGLTLVERPEGSDAAQAPAPLFNEMQSKDFKDKWSQIQTGFVDEPRRSVQDADKLVESLMRQLTEGFAAERSNLEKQWDKGDRISTEDLRLALQRYRSFFDRLLKI